MECRFRGARWKFYKRVQIREKMYTMPRILGIAANSFAVFKNYRSPWRRRLAQRTSALKPKQYPHAMFKDGGDHMSYAPSEDATTYNDERSRVGGFDERSRVGGFDVQSRIGRLTGRMSFGAQTRSSTEGGLSMTFTEAFSYVCKISHHSNIICLQLVSFTQFLCFAHMR